MYSFMISFVMFFFRLLPSTRCYALKAMILNILGFKISRSARFVSSLKVSGVCKLEVGEGSFVGHDVCLYGNGSFLIGSNVDIGPQVKLLTGGHDLDLLPARAAGTGHTKNIIIENGAWVGACSVILPGVRVGKSSIIAAGSVVIRDVPEHSLFAGNPAVFKRKI